MTSAQSRAHFLRQAKGFLQAAQILSGKLPFSTVLPLAFFMLTFAARASMTASGDVFAGIGHKER